MQPDRPQQPIQKDGILENEEQQRAWRAAKLRALIEDQTPSEIMEAMTGRSVEKFGIDGLDEEKNGWIDESAHQVKIDEQHRFSPAEIAQLTAVIKEEVYLLVDHGLILTKKQLAAELGVKKEALDAMTEAGFHRLGLRKILPQGERQTKSADGEQ